MEKYKSEGKRIYSCGPLIIRIQHPGEQLMLIVDLDAALKPVDGYALW